MLIDCESHGICISLSLNCNLFFSSPSLLPPLLVSPSPFSLLPPFALPIPSPSLYSPHSSLPMLSPSLYSPLPYTLSSSPPLLLSPAPPGQVDNTTVRSENLSLRRTRLIWNAPEDNNAPITTYWIIYCIPITDSTNDSCMGQTTIAIRDPAVPMISLTDISPQRRYRITIQAENAAGMGPESQPYFFDSATAGRCW